MLAPVVALLGLHDAFRTPLFLLIALTLTLSTMACAWERSRTAMAEYRAWRIIPRGTVDALRSRPSWNVQLPAGSDHSGVSQLVAEALVDLGMRVRSGSRLVQGVSRVAGLWGSPVFHWALAGLFLSAGLGQLSRWEAKIGLPVGHTIADVSESYAFPRSGPLSAAIGSGGAWRASRFDPEFVKDGVERGFTAYVELADPAGDVLVAHAVYPNRPLRTGALLAHRDGWGMASVLVLETDDGTEVGRRYDYFDFEDLDEQGVVRNELAVPPALGLSSLEAAVPLDRADDEDGAFRGDLPGDPRLEFTLVTVSGEETGPVTLRPGETLELPESELTLRVVDVTRYFRLLVVHDRSIPFIYAFFVLATMFGAVALLYTPRSVLCLLTESEDGALHLNVRVRARRVDPAFEPRVRAALERAMERTERSSAGDEGRARASS